MRATSVAGEVPAWLADGFVLGGSQQPVVVGDVLHLDMPGEMGILQQGEKIMTRRLALGTGHWGEMKVGCVEIGWL
jgi:hypothetical protein